MTHDPFQAYATLGPYSAVPNQLTPFMGQPNYAPFAAGLNPLAVQQQLQLASILGAQNPLGMQQNPLLSLLQNPWTSGQQNPQIHPLVAQALGLQPGLPQPFLNQQGGFGQGGYGSPLGQTGNPYGQTGNPYGQIGQQFGQPGFPLAPQSWIGQTGLPGQINPLYQQLVARALTMPGIFPGAAF